MSNVGYIWIPSNDKDVWGDIELYIRECVPYDSLSDALDGAEEDYRCQERYFGTTGPMCIVKVSVEVVHDDASDEPDYDQFDRSYEDLSSGY